MSWTIPVKSLNAVTTVAYPGSTGTSIDLDEVANDHACHLIYTLANDNDEGAISIEGSLDGSNWYTLGSSSAFGLVVAGTYSVLIVVLNQPARYVRSRAYAAVGFPVATTYLTSRD